jgi:F420-0:gamma-glutamyl ligase-like protein
LKLKAIKVKTRYWRPGTDWVREVVDSVEGVVRDGDVVTVSEKAISTAQGLMIDESKVKPGRLARFLASIWMRKIWGGPLGRLTKLRGYTVERLRSYPLSEGAAHKQVALEQVGILQSLRHYSEGGIDASNLPYSYVSLPLSNPDLAAVKLREAIAEIGSRVTTLIVDGDTTYSRGNIHLSPRNVGVSGLIHLGGFLTFVFGRMWGFTSRSTPIAYSGGDLNPDWALTLANVTHRVRGHGAGRTVWDMIERLGVDFTGVTWGMLDLLDHYPILILRQV